MVQGDDVGGASLLDFELWRALLRLNCGRNVEVTMPGAFAGWMRPHRLDHAAHLLHRRALTGSGQPLSEIAYACGFRDYVRFARRFRRRFGYSPGAHAGEGAVRAGTAESALWARDVRFRTS